MFYSSIRKILYLSTILMFMAACGSANQPGASEGNSGIQKPGTANPCEQTSSIKGSVVSVSHNSAGNFLGGLLLDGTKEQNAAFSQVYARVRKTTQVYEKQGSECRTVSFSSISAGQRILMQSTGTVMQSAPPQIEAVQIVIMER